MHYGDNQEAFHSKASMRQLMELQRQAMHDAVRALPEQQLKPAATDKLIESLADKYSINIPVLDEENPSPARREVDIDMARDPRRSFMGGPGIVKGTEITISVAFTGDAEIFRWHASSHTMSYPRGHIGKTSITFSTRGQNLDASQVRAEFDRWLVVIKQHLQGMKTELGNFNEAIKAEITTAINARLEKIKRDDDLLSGLGFRGQKASQ